MTSPLYQPRDLYQPSREEALPEGMLEYSAETAINDLIALHGFEKARERIAEILNAYCERKVQQ